MLPDLVEAGSIGPFSLVQSPFVHRRARHFACGFRHGGCERGVLDAVHH